jgi:hypothetical protein
MPTPPPERVKKRRKRSLLERHRWVWLTLIVAIIAGSTYAVFRIRREAMPDRLPGYLDSSAMLEQEFSRFHGRMLRDANVVEQFNLAAKLVTAHDYRGAIATLEPIAAQAAVPVVFNNLGVLYEHTGDRARAINAFREALARDAGYQPVRLNLQRLKNYTIGAAEPVTHEVEPNNNYLLANVVRLDGPVEAAIGGMNDEDYFRFTAPPAPRDRVEIRIENRSKTLIPALGLLDVDRRYVLWEKAYGERGANLAQYLSPAPNTTWYLQVWGFKDTAGDYILTVHPMHAFDAYEPNDDLFNATTLPPGQTIEANIMDERDTDFYTFVSARNGRMTVQLENRSSTLLPALSLYAGDRRFMGFGPDVRAAGAGLKHSFAVEDGRTYYVQVWSQANSSGAYALTLKSE